ncbi:helix-turn-helix transcriptional regulator [Streptomyces sp. NPDC050508]
MRTHPTTTHLSRALKAEFGRTPTELRHDPQASPDDH